MSRTSLDGCAVSVRRRQRGIGRRACVCLLVACASLAWATLHPLQADAAATVTVSDAVGFGNYYGRNVWVPVAVHVHNAGAEKYALLSVAIRDNAGSTRVVSGTLEWPVWLPAKSSTTAHVLIPGPVLADAATLTLSASGVTLATVPLGGNPVGKVALVAVLASHAQDAQFLTGSENGSTGAPVLPVTVLPTDLPASANGLAGLTALVSTPLELAQLSGAQTAALKGWVKLGGLLVVTGTEDASAPWSADLPLVAGRRRTVTADGLTALVGGVAGKLPQLSIDSSGTTASATVWAAAAGLPLIAEQNDGRGSIVQTAFSPLQPTMLTWPGNAALWTAVLREGDARSLRALPSFFSPSGPFSLAAASDVLAPLRVPSIRFWALLVGLYIFLAGPVLFLLLRRYRFEHAAWVVLPLFSVIVTVGIYSFGATERPRGLLTESVGVLELVGNGGGEAYGVRAFMSPQTTDISVSSRHPLMALPVQEKNPAPTAASALSTAAGAKVTFRRVPRWNLKYAVLAGAVTNQGQLTADIVDLTSVGLISGSVENDTHYPLDNVALCWNGHVFPLGNLAPGQSVTVNETKTSEDTATNWLATYSAYNRTTTHGIGRSLLSLASSAGLFEQNIGIDNAMIVATTTAPTPGLGSLQSTEPVASVQLLTLVREFVAVDVQMLHTPEVSSS